MRRSYACQHQIASNGLTGNCRRGTSRKSLKYSSSKLVELTSGKASELGLKLISADVKDIRFPGEMKKAFAQVVKAQKDGQAAPTLNAPPSLITISSR